MKKHLAQWAVGRESRASTYFAVLFGTSVLTILAIRGFLALTNYPKLGGDSLHIAHMLWGGLFMLVALVMFIYIHGHRAKLAGSFLGGVGFGFFIDELGKFITNDNDYFYQPTAMLLYILFLLLWSLLEWLDNYTPITPRQKFVDLLTRVRDGSIHGLSADDNQKIYMLLDDLKMTNKDQALFMNYVNKYAPIYQPQTFLQKSNALLLYWSKTTRNIIKSKVTKFMVYVAVALTSILSFMVIIVAIIDKRNIFDLYTNAPAFIEIGLMLAVAITMICVFVGLINTKLNWQKTLVWYRRALLVNIFATQVFLFYINQFSAVFGLAFSLMLLYVITVLLQDYEIK
jgi:hypothetical protein